MFLVYFGFVVIYDIWWIVRVGYIYIVCLEFELFKVLFLLFDEGDVDVL